VVEGQDVMMMVWGCSNRSPRSRTCHATRCLISMTPLLDHHRSDRPASPIAFCCFIHHRTYFAAVGANHRLKLVNRTSPHTIRMRGTLHRGEDFCSGCCKVKGVVDVALDVSFGHGHGGKGSLLGLLWDPHLGDFAELGLHLVGCEWGCCSHVVLDREEVCNSACWGHNGGRQRDRSGG
jgi:hypothetical protein